MLYGAVMMFNTDFMMDRYPTFDNNQTTDFFLTWFGAVTLFLCRHYYMGFKGLDRGFFAYAIPVVLLQVIWIIMSNAQTGEENITGLVVWIIGLLALLVVLLDIEQECHFTYKKLILLALQTKHHKLWATLRSLWFINIVSYVIGSFVDPNINDKHQTLKATTQAEMFAWNILFNIALLISLVYQYRVGFSGVLNFNGCKCATMFLRQ